MPSLSRFYGITIKMYFKQSEHNPPHIHAIYGENVAVIDILNGEIIEGYLPTKALSLVREWLSLHKDEIKKIWETQNFEEIDPLE